LRNSKILNNNRIINKAKKAGFTEIKSNAIEALKIQPELKFEAIRMK
jgi:hypothetical protein